MELARALDIITSEGSDALDQFRATNATAVINSLEGEINLAMDKKTVQEKFDALVMLTYAMTIYDHWLSSVTCPNKIKKLGTALLQLEDCWAGILMHEPCDLGIHEADEYTLSGTLALLKKLKEKCEGVSDCTFSVNPRGEC